MNAPASRFRSVLLIPAAVFAAASTAFAGDTVLHKVPSERSAASGGTTSYGFVNLQTRQPRALYVTSGSELRQANNMVDGQTATTFRFASGDSQPTAVIDLGSVRSLRRVTVNHLPQQGTMSVYVVRAVPGLTASTDPADAPQTLKVDATTWDGMKEVGSSTNDGAQAGTTVSFPETAGRYLLLRWTPAVMNGAALTVAEVAAFGGDEQRTASTHRRRYNDVSDSKDVADTKDVVDTKDVPEEGPEAPPPGEGPPPSLPPPPPFTFIPQLVPTSE